MSERDTSGESRQGKTDFGFRRVPESEKAPLVRAVFDSVAGRYDLMNDLMSAGIHRWWKAEMIAWLNPRPGQQLIDVAGGTGDIACRALPRLSPETGGQVIVCDATFEMLETGRARAIDDGILDGIEWLCGDAELLPVADRCCDLYAIAFGLRNVTRIERAEAAGIVEADDRAVIERQDDVIMLRIRAFRIASGDAARHAEMQQQEAGLVELDQDVFAAPREAANPRAV